MGKQVKIEYTDLLDYMHLMEMAMFDNKIKYNELKAMETPDESGSRADIMKSLKEQNEKHWKAWHRMNKIGGEAGGVIEIFNGNKKSDIKRWLC